MGRFHAIVAALALAVLMPVINVGARHDSFLKLMTDGRTDGDTDPVGTKWALLIAGSNGYMNYRHQADICHAYQIMKAGGLKDENIIVFMYDDIADNEENPRRGVIINRPEGGDVYAGVPKDYVGDDVNVGNFIAALLGDRSGLSGGSGKVVDSGPDDSVFVYYADHGGPGILGMPTKPHLYADDVVSALKKKHAMGAYKSLVFYLESCESGTIFDGLLPNDINIYATTAANATESSWATYCPGQPRAPPPEYETCLGDVYSVAWMEDSDAHDLRTVTLKQQYDRVRDRTSPFSPVMQYGDLKLSAGLLDEYMGSKPIGDNASFIEDNSLPSYFKGVNERDADLVYYWNKFIRSPEGSTRRSVAERQLLEELSHRVHVDDSIELVGRLIFGYGEAGEVMETVRPAGQPLVDDWDCFKSMVGAFESHCGALTQNGMKHTRSLANICNAGVKEETMAEAAAQACRGGAPPSP